MNLKHSENHSQNSENSKLSIVFCGSFRHYSVAVLQGLIDAPHLNVIGVVTTPPRPAGRDQKLRKTEVHRFAEAEGIPIFHPEHLDDSSLQGIEEKLQTIPNFLLTAGYGKLIPPIWLEWPETRSLNLHFSMLPAFRGANPAEWALLMDAATSGITLMEMDEHFDTGGIIQQEAIALQTDDTRESVYERLYRLGGKMIPLWLTADALPLKTTPQAAQSPTPYARLLKRNDSYVSWWILESLLSGKKIALRDIEPYDAKDKKGDLGQGIMQAFRAAGIKQIHPRDLERATRALHGFPGVWTLLPTGPSEHKRMKILSTAIVAGESDAQNEGKLKLKKVQIAGQKPATWSQVKTALYSSSPPL